MVNSLSVDIDHEPEFDGNALLLEQMELLTNATPAEIKDIYFLKLKLSVMEKNTAEQDQFQRTAQQWDGGELHLRRRDAGGPSTKSISSNFPPNLKDTSRSPLQDPTPSVLGNGSWNFSFPKGENPRPLGILSSQLSRGPRGALARSVAPSSSGNTSLKEDTRDLAPHNPMDELPASVAMRRSLGGGFKANSLTPSDASNQLIQAKSALDEGSSFLGINDALPKDELTLEPCMYCGRTFAVESLKRHVDACRRHHENSGKSVGYNAKLKQPFQSGDSSFSASVLSRLDTSKSLGGVERAGYE